MTNFERVNELEINGGNLPGFLDNETLRKWKIIGEKETLKDAFARVAKSIASLEDDYDGDIAGFEANIMDQLLSKKIIPSTPILMNAGRFKNVTLSACIVPLIEFKDDWSKIKTKVDELHLQGMGTGFNFDETDNPIYMIKFLNQVGIDGQKDERQLRPVGNIGTMSLGNPKIIEFINLKDDAEIRNEDWVFNLSVSINNEQIDKILNKDDITLADGRKISADEILDNLAKAMWLSGDPGLVFMDRVKADNTVPSAGESISMAPCGEIGLARGESCQFSYINLGKFVNNGEVNYKELGDTINFSIHFLDNVVDYNIKNSSNAESVSMMRNKRKIGLGICGFDDLLKNLSLRYGSEESIELAGELLSFINYHSKRSSVELAKQRGAFKMFNESQFVGENNHLMNRIASEQTKTVSKNEWADLIKEIKENGIRHCATISLPPTGRSSQIIGASQSIEPNFKDFLKVTSHEQISVIAEIQKFVDESISKTINVKNETTIDEIKQMLLDSMSQRLKGITIYRDGSRSNQPEKM
ncbi:MAG: ribonucleotide reductase N-terminal alpha domain-containing protein [Candidatus Moranbacteria bacterium]|nr:ribonucleotide reductase N-terminal alpha domain-containing protein [Candidatus Moranbacteria bacterium]